MNTEWSSFLSLLGLKLNIATWRTVIWPLLVSLAVVLWVVHSFAQRYALKGLLLYKGWMFDPRG